MNELGTPLKTGTYCLNGSLKVRIERRPDNSVHMDIGSNSLVRITMITAGAQHWDVWYTLNKQERKATLVKTP
jgi:hypothetical protein